MEKTAQGLLDAIVVLGRLPVIRTPRDGPAEMVGKKLIGKLEKVIKENRQIFFPSGSSSLGTRDEEALHLHQSSSNNNRPLLLILDRDFDMVTPLLHSDVYRCLIDDVMQGGIKLNRTQVVVEGKPQTLELDPEVDAFWGKHGNASLPGAYLSR